MDTGTSIFKVQVRENKGTILHNAQSNPLRNCCKPNTTLTAVYGQIRIVTPEAELKYAIPLHA
jgi:hypothetical protein